MESLPLDVFLVCFSYLGSDEAINMAMLSQHFRVMMQNQSIWKAIAQKEWPVSIRLWRSAHPFEVGKFC